jgi:hypothetical protein
MYIDIDVLYLILALCLILAYLSISQYISTYIQVANPIFLIKKIPIHSYLNLTGLTIPE